MTARGGDQEIPRPPDAELGAPAPWEGLPAERRSVDLGTLQRRLAEADPPRLIRTPMPARATWRSAVLAAVYDDDGVHVVLTRRARHLRSHHGEVSFPGGREEPHDPDLWATALREAQEEIGLRPETVEEVGALDRLTTYTSRAEIHPFVGRLPGPPDDLRAEPNEVEAILPVRLDELTADGVYREERWRFPTGRVRPMYFFDLIGDTVWGATARLLRQLCLVALDLPDPAAEAEEEADP